MDCQFDRIVIAVPELAAASAQYQSLLGAAPCTDPAAGAAPSAWWGLPNTVIELVQRPVDSASIEGFVLKSAAAGGGDCAVANDLGLDIVLSDGRRTADFRREQQQFQCTGMLVDHLVLRTGDAQACIELFRDRLGIRLALEKKVPEWGGRMLFFRAGKLTLEVIQSDGAEPGRNFFWGIAYQCPALEPAVEILRERGVLLSAVREGRKPGTRVATVKSHCLAIPTLLIEPAR
jgi:catechol 2,3-dioxygenase-like lactoylglutathione lyase family enzyme